jgi:hypothetical protein
MTTDIMIVNKGPKLVYVLALDHGATKSTLIRKLEPGQVADAHCYVFEGCDIVVSETAPVEFVEPDADVAVEVAHESFAEIVAEAVAPGLLRLGDKFEEPPPAEPAETPVVESAPVAPEPADVDDE